MHMPGDPRTMHLAAELCRRRGEVRHHLIARASDAIAAGVDPERVCIDPGIGFGKTVDHNLELLARLGELHRVASRSWWERRASRSSGRLLDLPDPAGATSPPRSQLHWLQSVVRPS